MCQRGPGLRRIKRVPLEPVIPAGAGVERQEEKNICLPMGKQEKRVRQNRDVPRQEVPAFCPGRRREEGKYWALTYPD